MRQSGKLIRVKIIEAFAWYNKVVYITAQRGVLTKICKNNYQNEVPVKMPKAPSCLKGKRIQHPSLWMRPSDHRHSFFYRIRYLIKIKSFPHQLRLLIKPAGFLVLRLCTKKNFLKLSKKWLQRHSIYIAHHCTLVLYVVEMQILVGIFKISLH